MVITIMFLFVLPSVAVLGFFLGKLIRWNSYDSEMKESLKNLTNELEFYKRNIKIFHKFERLRIPLDNLVVLTENAFIEDGILFPTPVVAQNPVIVLQDSVTDAVYIYVYQYTQRYVQRFRPPREMRLPIHNSQA